MECQTGGRFLSDISHMYPKFSSIYNQYCDPHSEI